eukprot:jgi/Ulvmu1/9807/UM056_0047.1
MVSCMGCRKKKVTGRYQLQFPLNWVRSELRGRTAEEWREVILAAWEASPVALQQQWRQSFHLTMDDLMKTTLTVKNRTGRRFDRDAYAREAHLVYGPAVSPSDAPPKLLARCFKHSVDFVVHHGLSISSVADSFTNTGEHTVPSDTYPQALVSEGSTDAGDTTECDSSASPKMTFCFGGEPVPAPDRDVRPGVQDCAEADVQEQNDKYTPLLDEMLKWDEDQLFSLEDDLQLSVDFETVGDGSFADDCCPIPSQTQTGYIEEGVWRSKRVMEEMVSDQGGDADGCFGVSVEQQLLRAREDLTAARQQRDDAVMLCQQLQAQLAKVLEQREQSPGTDVPEDGCFRNWVKAWVRWRDGQKQFPHPGSQSLMVKLTSLPAIFLWQKSVWPTHSTSSQLHPVSALCACVDDLCDSGTIAFMSTPHAWTRCSSCVDACLHMMHSTLSLPYYDQYDLLSGCTVLLSREQATAPPSIPLRSSQGRVVLWPSQPINSITTHGSQHPCITHKPLAQVMVPGRCMKTCECSRSDQIVVCKPQCMLRIVWACTTLSMLQWL